ncbi:hypothetical protein Tco_0649615 [Tanacetum coccineum]
MSYCITSCHMWKDSSILSIWRKQRAYTKALKHQPDQAFRQHTLQYLTKYEDHLNTDRQTTLNKGDRQAYVTIESSAGVQSSQVAQVSILFTPISVPLLRI